MMEKSLFALQYPVPSRIYCECWFITGRIFSNRISIIIQVRCDHCRCEDNLMLNFALIRYTRDLKLKIMTPLYLHSFVFHCVDHAETRVSKERVLGCGG